ncbi:MAG: choice-of-anchor Q domain-containing protein [Spirosomataceae bacterium]
MKKQLLSTFLLIAVGCSIAQATTYTVTNTNDAGTGSLRAAIIAANADAAAPHLIQIDASLTGQTISLLSSLPNITRSMTIRGASTLTPATGAGGTTVERNTSAADFRLFDFGNVSWSVEDLILSNGRLIGAAIRAGNNTSRTATVERCIIKNCYAPTNDPSGSSILIFFGQATVRSCIFQQNQGFKGGVAFVGTSSATVESCTFLLNVGQAEGGGISNQDGTVSVTNCTFYMNSTLLDDYGAGAAIFTFGTSLTTQTTIKHCTFVSNQSNLGAAIAGFRIDPPTAITLQNCLFKGNTGTNGNFFVDGGATLTSLGGNVSDAANGTFLNQASDKNSQSFSLGALANNGGLVTTIALLAGSPALNAGVSSSVTTDARGQARVNAPDAGAYEACTKLDANFTTSSGKYYLCPGTSLTLTTPYRGDVTYEWLLNNYPISPPAATNTLPITQAGPYTLKVKEGVCGTEVSKLIYINTPTPVAYSASYTVSATKLTLQANPSGLQYSWSGPNGFSSALRNPVIMSPNITHSGTYTVNMLVPSTGCMGSATTKVSLTNPARLAEEEAEAIEMDINAYPNPVTNILTVEISLKEPSALQLNLVNSVGKLSGAWQLQEVSTFHKTELNLADLQGGVYLLQAQAGKQKTLRRIVKVMY